MAIIILTKQTARPFYPFMFSLCRPYIGNENFIAYGIQAPLNGQPIGALTATRSNDFIKIHSLLVEPTYRRQQLASECMKKLQTFATNNNCQAIIINYVLPATESSAVDAFLQYCDFQTPNYEGEIFCFNPYRIVSTKFVKKTFTRGKPFLPVGWQALRYNELDTATIKRIAASKASFPADIDWDSRWDSLDLAHSIILLNNTDIIGYISQQRLSPHCVAVPCFAVNPSYRSAGIYLLKYYMYIIHFETPEILEVRCHFTPKTIAGKKLFEYYTENRYNRHSIEKSSRWLVEKTPFPAPIKTSNSRSPN